MGRFSSEIDPLRTLMKLYATRKAEIALCGLPVGLGSTKKGSTASATTPLAGPLVGVQDDVNASAKSNKAKG